MTLHYDDLYNYFDTYKTIGYDAPWEKPRQDSNEPQDFNIFGPAQSRNKEEEFNLDDIRYYYTTTLPEDKRTTFEETFGGKNTVSADTTTITLGGDDTACFKFYNSLVDNKDSLMRDLKLSEEQYDALACIAMALASQETGMGKEKGYWEEQSGINSFVRKAGINMTSEHSASSGVTQIKIFDRIYKDGLDPKYIRVLKDHGVTVENKVTDNLVEADKAAVATIVLLESIVQNYDNYRIKMAEAHESCAGKFSLDQIKISEAEQKGFDYLSDIYSEYQKMTDEEKKEARDALKYLFLSEDGSTREKPSKDGEKYTEEIQFERVKEIFKGKIEFEDDALRYMRFAMCSPDCTMDITEYCAYAWNNGTGDTGMQIDRTIAAKMGIILSDPEEFDYGNYSANVVALIEKYAQQSVGEGNSYYSIEDALRTHEFK